MAWIAGRYNLEAFQVVMSHFSAGLAGKKSHAEYMNHPILYEAKNAENKNKESQEEVALYEMKQRIRLLRDSGLPESPD